MKVLLLEDDLGHALTLESMVKAMKSVEKLDFSHVSNMTEFLDYLKDQVPDVIISDIVIGNDTIFDLFQKDNLEFDNLIAITSYQESDYVEKSTQLGAKVLLGKPVNPMSLEHAILSIINSKSNGNRVLVKHKNSVLVLNSMDISHIAVDGNYTYVFSKGKKYVKRRSLKDFLQHHKNFIRIHRTAAVNPEFVEEFDIGKNQVVVYGQILPLGRRYKKNFLEQITVGVL
jgi:DNA-binding LytR/AlgR family response regulator